MSWRAGLGVAMVMGAAAVQAASRSHPQCPWGLDGPTARVIASPQAWRETLSADEDRVLGTAVDWTTHHVLVFALGQQRSLGVQVTAEPGDLVADGRDRRLEVVITRPGPDDMVAMALSRPCVVMAVPRQAWRRLVVVDRTRGEVVWRGRLKPRR